MWLRLFALAFATGVVIAGPFQKETGPYCAKQCRPRQQEKLKWKVGSAYVYHYQSENNVTYGENQTQKSSIEAIVEYHILSKCDGLLKMKNVKINQKLTEEEKEDLKIKLESPLVYSYGDGTFEATCPSHDESTQSLNIKKALISSFVISMSKLDTAEETEEHDSLGKCFTKYSIKNGEGLIIKKEKDLTTCTNRHTFLGPLLKQKFPSTLIFESDHLECQQYIENEVIKKVVCMESERMKPPMKDQNSWIEFSGSFIQELQETKTADNFQLKKPLASENILYELEESRKGDSNKKGTEHILRKLCSQNNNVVNISVSSDFMKLVDLTKGLSYEQLYTTYESLENGKLCSSKKVRDIFVDTLPVIGTDASVKLMVKLIENQVITGLKAKLWPASFALISKPTPETAAAIIPLLKRDYSIPVILGVSAMIHRLCSIENCYAIESVDEIISILNKYLGQNCSADDFDKSSAALKAFGNMGYHGKARENIIACAKDISKTNRLRLAAIDAFRRINAKRPDELIEIYSNKDEDYEIRIASFASLLKHADYQQLQKIKEIAENETDEQVSGYVHTFLRNLKKASSPEKQKIRKLCDRIEIRPPYVNYWENSKNIEVSGFSESLRIGGGIEADVIHSSGSKIPRSAKMRLNVDIFDKSVDLLEFGIRAEGLEEFVKKVIGLKDNLPKKRFWDLFSSKHLTGTSDTELSLFIRTLNTEIFDVSASDFSGLGEMIQIAEIMNKLSHGKNADFSQSLVFLNSKLVIPSVTGRSYTIDFTGTSTVGVTARSKVDLLSLPRNADVHLHFQPSANVEVSTTVGIQSNKRRPDVKIVSRLYLESNIEAKFQIKDGHIAIASLTMPSENVALIKMSTDVLEIDSDHKEKRIFNKMQKKMDYCFKGLQNTLGITAHASVEVPKPFVIKTFPYLLLFGSTEFALRKSDDSFSSYEIHLEIPKHTSSIIKYKASVDTPGSKISRRFAADLEIKQLKDQKRFSMELTSPFKTLGGSGSYTKNDKLIEGSFEFHSNFKEIFSLNLTSKIIPSRSMKTYETAGVVSYLDQEPTRINGSMTITKGRKHRMNFTFRTNKPLSKPVILKGTIMKEGYFDLLHRVDGRLSSELLLESPLGDVKIRSTTEARSKKLQSVSVNLGIDYQKPGEEKHSIKFSGTTQKSQGKINMNSKFEIAQFPEANWYFNWDIQRESKESFRNNMILKCGNNFDKNFIHLQQRSHMPELSNGENMISLKIPNLDIDYELSFKYDLKLTSTPTLYAEANMRYKNDKHINGIVNVNYESKSPLKISAKLELEYPGGHYIYEDEIVETSNNIIEGKTKFQYEHEKAIQLKYKYKKLSDDSKFHHEIESSLRTPVSSTPIKSKISLQFNSKSLTAVGQIGPKYSVQAYVSRKGPILINVKSPLIDGKMKLTSVRFMKNLNLDLNMKNSNPRHITASILAENLSQKKTFQLEIVPDVDRQSENKIFVSSVVELTRKKSGDSYCALSKLQMFDLIDISLSGSGAIPFHGNQEIDLAYTVKGWTPTKVTLRKEAKYENSSTIINISRKEVDVAKIRVDTRLIQNYNKQNLLIKGYISSPNHSFDGADLYLTQEITRSNYSKSIKSHLFFKIQEKVFKTEWDFVLQPNSMELKAEVETPYISYKRQAFGIHFKRSSSEIRSLLNIEIPNNEVIFIGFDILKRQDKFIAFLNLNSTFEKLEAAQVNFVLYHPSFGKFLELDINVKDSKNKFSDMKQIFGMKLSITESSFEGGARLLLMDGKYYSIESETKFQTNLFTTETNLFTTTDITTGYEKLKNIKVHLTVENQPLKRNLTSYFELNGEQTGYIELFKNSSSNSFEVQGHLKAARIPEILIRSEFQKRGDTFLFAANILKNRLPLLATNLERLPYNEGNKLIFKSKSFENTLLDVEVSETVSGENVLNYSLKANGHFSPVSLTFSTNHNDNATVCKEFVFCQEVHPVKCYLLKSYHKKLINIDNYRFYQNFTVDLTKVVGAFPSEVLGSLHVFVSKSQYDYMSKVLFKKNDQKVGYELKLHRREHENDKFVMDTYGYLPQISSNLRASILHNTHLLNMELEAIPNIIDSTNKFYFEMKKENCHPNKGFFGYMKMSHPEMSQPLLLSYEIQEVKNILPKVKLGMHFSSEKGKTLIAEMIPTLEKKPYGSKSIIYKLYTENESLNVSLMLTKEISSKEDKVGYEWIYRSGSSKKKGGITITFSNMTNGRPKSIKISLLTPTFNYEIQGSIAQTTNGANLTLLSGRQKIREILMKTTDSCLDIEITRSDEDAIMKSSFCGNQRENDTLQLVKADLYYHQNKCLDIRTALSAGKPAFLDVALKWKASDISRALSEVFGWKEIHSNKLLSNITKELNENFNQLKKDVFERLKEKLLKKLKIIEEEISMELKNILSRHSEFLRESLEAAKNIKNSTILYMKSSILWNHIKNEVTRPLKEVYRDYIQEYTLRASKYIQGCLKVGLEVTNARIGHYWKTFCNSETICHRFLQTYKFYSARRIKDLIFSKNAEMGKDLKVRISGININNVINWIHNFILQVKKTIHFVFGKFGDKIISKIGDFGKKLEKFLRQKAIDAIDKLIDYINKIFRDDEDYKIAKSLIIDAKKKLINAWINKEEIIESSLRPIENKLEKNLRNFMNGQFQVLEFDLKDGEIKLRFRQPLGPVEIQILRNELQVVKRKLEEFLHR